MDILLGLVVLYFGGRYLIRSVSQARNQAWAGPRTAGMRQRAASRGSGQRPVRHEMRLQQQAAYLKDWLAERDHARKNGNGTSPPARPPAVPGRAKAAAAATVKRLGQLRPSGGNGGAPGISAQPGPPAARPSPAPAPAPARPAPAGSGSRGRTATVASNGTGGTEQLVEGYSQIYAGAVAGGIHAKLHAIKASTEGSVRGSQMAAMLSRSMSEPGANYGPEITEPIAKAAQHQQAAAMAWAEADAALTTLMNTSVGELAQSPRQAPHHAELSENGSR